MRHSHPHHHDHEHEDGHVHDEGQLDSTRKRIRILAIDVGAGTQDILIYESDKTPENCFKLVLPSQTQIVAHRIRQATAARRPVHLAGVLM
ncbi:MAG TPA: hypothetical protein VKB09_17265, partial [Thermomicrobiales bacterium]|nr:hypothetical protein [Thermomicrobiales bacterium]